VLTNTSMTIPYKMKPVPSTEQEATQTVLTVLHQLSASNAIQDHLVSFQTGIILTQWMSMDH
jgi:ABC-type enterochelin transport system ATPase subunit